MKAVVLSPESELVLKPVRLSKAAAILSRFIAEGSCSGRGASAYLRLASAAFDELVEVHREIRAPRRNNEVKSREKGEDFDRKGKKRNGEVDDKGGNFDDRATKRRRELEAEDQ
ncbi:hypothetical protein DsansV1_C13g0121671 [Dioscorea sansibarensis]